MKKILLILALFCFVSSCKKEDYVTEGKQTVEHLKKFIKENNIKRLIPVVIGNVIPSSASAKYGVEYIFLDDKFLSIYDGYYGHVAYNLSFLVRYEVNDIEIDNGRKKEPALFLYFSH